MVSEFHPSKLALLTDLYELTMAASYFENNMFGPATFSLFVRKYPPNRHYFVSAGLVDVLTFLENFQFTQDDLAYLDTMEMFSPVFLDYLEKLRFKGDVYAIPEGSIFFKNEPILEVTAPIIQAQLVESFIINAINLQTVIATKASRCTYAASGRYLADFSLRRTQGVDAGIKVARASYIGGFGGTSNTLASKIYGIPVFGTMAHSYIQCFEHELDAFLAFARTFPENAVLLIDTYNTIAGAHKAVAVAKEMQEKGGKLRGVRLDSGDIAELSKQVRQIFDEAGLKDVMIFASGGFDEFKIDHVVRHGCEIDSFGVGTKMGVSADAPYLDMAYKLVRYAGKPVMKLSPGKTTLVDEKQVFRILDSDGKFKTDIIGLRDDHIEGASPLLIPVMAQGRMLGKQPTLAEIQKHFLKEFKNLDEQYKELKDHVKEYPVTLSPRLQELQDHIEHQIIEKELGES